MKKPEKPKKIKQPEPKVDDVLIEDNRFTPYGALPEHHPEHPVQGLPIEIENPDGEE